MYACQHDIFRAPANPFNPKEAARAPLASHCSSGSHRFASAAAYEHVQLAFVAGWAVRSATLLAQGLIHPWWSASVAPRADGGGIQRADRALVGCSRSDQEALRA